ncbi:uncharacterized protein LOC135835170 isoform X2 [Planococcus citri]|uniref:uncharacterized protein LOC135835170 isoform X2 n=1 Tax=Planococcus citri TaxID=170843 RepID=UPI0031F94F7E
MVFFTEFLVFMTVIGVISAKIDGWDTSPNTQYHIQTDEGPERYFRYQTISGQYRKEKRLQDGTVIGSYGWVDADGYLRLNDYIADNEGYRIVRTKRLFVGNQTPIDSALQSAKYVPPQAGTDVSSPTVKANIVPQQYPEDKSKFLLFPSSTQSPISSTYAPAPPDNSKFLLFPSSSERPVSPTTYSADKSKFLIFPGSTPLPGSSVYPKRRPTPPAGYYPSSTPPTVLAHEAENDATVAITPSTYVPVSKYYYPNKSLYKAPLYTSAVKSRPEYNQNSIISPSPSYFGDKVQYSRKSFDNETPYDGVSVTRNGFKYFLPRQYHEENSSGQERTGSFGYIDPFGIRRVVYYNASPDTGFVHRKNNRYVGFNATPYDPRP